MIYSFLSPFYIKVSVIHNKNRQGLIRSRLIGAKAASGKVLIFTDSHIKFEQNWLEPLVLRLLSYELHNLNPHLLVLSPFISAFTEDGRNYPAADYLRGGFDWDLTFTWEPMSDEEKDTVSRIDSFLHLKKLSSS